MVHVLILSSVLEGANPSAEEEDEGGADDGGDNQPVLDLADQFRLQKMEGGMSKKAYQSELKSMLSGLRYMESTKTDALLF